MALTWGGLFTYESINGDASCTNEIFVFEVVELLKDFGGLKRGTKFPTAQMDLQKGTIFFYPEGAEDAPELVIEGNSSPPGAPPATEQGILDKGPHAI